MVFWPNPPFFFFCICRGEASWPYRTRRVKEKYTRDRLMHPALREDASRNRMAGSFLVDHAGIWNICLCFSLPLLRLSLCPSIVFSLLLYFITLLRFLLSFFPSPRDPTPSHHPSSFPHLPTIRPPWTTHTTIRVSLAPAFQTSSRQA